MYRTSRRETWIDTAKGIAILLVVLHHATSHLAVAGLSVRTWYQVDLLLQSLRMPLFFLVSGLFAARSLAGPLRGFLHTKIARFAYLYVLWSLLYSGWYVVLSVGSDQTIPDVLVEHLWEAVIVHAGPWYLAALAVFFGLARLLRGLSLWVQLTATCVVSAMFGSTLVATGSWGPDHMAQYFVYFLAGVYFSAGIRRWTDCSSSLRLAVAAGLYIAATGAAFATDTLLTVGAAILPLVAVPAGLCLSREADKLRALQWLRWAGANTLPVYLLHVPVIATFDLLLARIPDDQPTAFLLAAPIAVAAVAVLICYALWLPLRRIHGLFELPISDDRARGVAPVRAV